MVFEVNMDRSAAFLRLFDGTGRRAGHPSNDEKELLRGSVVFAIGALDAFLHELVLEIVPTFGPASDHLSAALKTIAREDPSLSLRVALAADPHDRRSEFAAALDRWLSEKAFHGPEAVVRALGYVGCEIAWDQFDAELGWNGSAGHLGRFTDMRHDIVHRGRRPYIRRSIAGNCVELVSGIGGVVNREVVALHYG